MPNTIIEIKYVTPQIHSKNIAASFEINSCISLPPLLSPIASLKSANGKTMPKGATQGPPSLPPPTGVIDKANRKVTKSNRNQVGNLFVNHHKIQQGIPAISPPIAIIIMMSKPISAKAINNNWTTVFVAYLVSWMRVCACQNRFSSVFAPQPNADTDYTDFHGFLICVNPCNPCQRFCASAAGSC